MPLPVTVTQAEIDALVAEATPEPVTTISSAARIAVRLRIVVVPLEREGSVRATVTRVARPGW